MYIKKFSDMINEGYDEGSKARAKKYIELVDDVCEKIKSEVKEKWSNEKWSNAAELYDLTGTLIDSLGRLDDELTTQYTQKLEDISNSNRK